MVARDCGRTINTLITLDPVSNFTYNITMPDGVCDWYNIYVTGENYGLGDFIADIGGQWKDVNGATNIAASGLQHGDVMGMMVYASSNGYPVFGRTHVCE